MQPAHSLVDVQAEIKRLGVKAFTKAAIDGVQDTLGMTMTEAIDFLLSQTDTTCFKSMPSTVIAGAFHDVYHWQTPNGQTAYVKVCLHPDSKVVTSFKEK